MRKAAIGDLQEERLCRSQALSGKVAAGAGLNREGQGRGQVDVEHYVARSRRLFVVFLVRGDGMVGGWGNRL